MDRFKETPANTDVYARVKLVAANEIQRRIALNSLRDAEALVNGYMWIVNKIKGLFGNAGLKKA